MGLIEGSSSGGAVGFDPAGFQISVVMNTPDGVRLPLWIKSIDQGEGGIGAGMASAAGSALSAGGMGAGTGASGGSLSGADLANLDLPVVESASIEISLGLVGKVTVEVTATYELGLKLLDSPFFCIGNTIEVQIGYPRSKRFTPWISAITSKPSLRISPDEGLTATINGEGGAFAALRGVSGKTWEARSYREIIEEIAIEHDWDVSLPGDSVSARAVENLGLEVSEFLKTRPVVSQSQMTDWFFIQHLCLASGCHAFIGPSPDKGRFKLFVKERKSLLAAEPKVRLVSRGRSDFALVFPALEFETEAEFVWLPGGAVRTSTQDLDPDTKQIVSHDATAETSPDPALGDAGTPNSAKRKVESINAQLTHTDGTDRTGEFLVVSARDPRGASAVAQAHRDTLAIRGGVTAKVTTFGIPELLPGDIVQIDAMGVFNGLYGINSLTHTANDSEWSMSLDILNNASASGIFQKYFVDDQSNTNTSKVNEETGGEGDEIEVEAVNGAL